MTSRRLPDGEPATARILDHAEQAWKRELSMRHRVLSGRDRQVGVAEAEDCLRGIEILRRRHVETAEQPSLL